MKIVKSLEEFGLLIKDASKIIENEPSEQAGDFFGMLLGTLEANLGTLGNLLADKGTRASQ